MLTHPMDITPRRYFTDSISYRGVITPRHKYPRYVHSILAGRSRDILHTVTWNVKTETSSYLRDVFGHKRPSLRWMEPCGTSSRDITPRCHWIHVSLGLILSLTDINDDFFNFQKIAFTKLARSVSMDAIQLLN